MKLFNGHFAEMFCPQKAPLNSRRNLLKTFFIDYSRNIINQVEGDWNLYEILQKAFIEFVKSLFLDKFSLKLFDPYRFL